MQCHGALSVFRFWLKGGRQTFGSVRLIAQKVAQILGHGTAQHSTSQHSMQRAKLAGQ
jgi:hypothetical protein